jgi:hypothetical protein
LAGNQTWLAIKRAPVLRSGSPVFRSIAKPAALKPTHPCPICTKRPCEVWRAACTDPHQTVSGLLLHFH